MNSRPGRGARPSGGYVAAMRDPLVPLDFGHWLRRVYGAFRRSFGRLAVLALVPMTVSAAARIVVDAVRLSPAETRRQLVAASAVSPAATSDMWTGFWIVFRPVLPAILIFGVLAAVVGAFYQGCAYYLVLRQANGQPSSTIEALRVAAPRVLPLLGWAVATWLLITIALAIPLVPGLRTDSRLVAAICLLLAAVLLIVLGVIILSSLLGVVLIERAGLARCLQLIKGQFWATFGRMAVIALIYLGYSLAVGLLISLALRPFGGVHALSGVGSAIVHIVNAALTIPALVFLVTATLVTYAELRFKENTATSTRTLAAEMIR
jgi:hypothetical protein